MASKFIGARFQNRNDGNIFQIISEEGPTFKCFCVNSENKQTFTKRKIEFFNRNVYDLIYLPSPMSTKFRSS